MKHFRPRLSRRAFWVLCALLVCLRLALPGWLIGFVPENDGTATAGQLAVYYNPERTRQWASLPAGTWRKVSDGVHAGVTPFGPCFRDALELAPTSVTVLVAE